MFVAADVKTECIRCLRNYLYPSVLVKSMSMFNRYAPYAPLVARVALALVFLWFGLNQIFDPDSFLGYLPPWTSSLPFSDTTFLLLNGIFEILCGGLLLVGFCTRAASALLALHLLGIADNLGYNDIMIRDFGLTLVLVSIFLNGPDRWCLDSKNSGAFKSVEAL